MSLQVLAANRSAIETKLGATFEVFEPVSQRTQVVAGTNFFIKVHTGNSNYIHVTIYRMLNGSSELSAVESGKKESDEL